MSQSTTGKNIVARRYGRVLLQLAQEKKKTKDVMKDATTLETLVKENPKEWAIITNPTTPQTRQDEIIAALTKPLKLNALTSQFLHVLVLKGRLPLLKRILHQFTGFYKEAHNQVDACLKTSTSLPKKELSGLSSSLKKSTGLDITLTHEVDPSLLGGAVLRVGSVMVDASVGTRLSKLRQTMKG